MIANLDVDAQLGELMDGRQCGQLGWVQEHQETLEEQVRFVLTAEAGLDLGHCAGRQGQDTQALKQQQQRFLIVHR